MLREYVTWPTTLMLLISIFAMVIIAWRRRKSRKAIQIHVKDWLRIEAPQSIVLLACSLLLLWGVHRGAQEWAQKKLEKRPQSAGQTKPFHGDHNEWLCARGIAAYNNLDYDGALKHFAEIGKLSGPAFVRWKFYEAMAIFRREQYRKAVTLEDPNYDAVDAACSRLRAIVEQHQDDILYTGAKYWYAQCLRYLRGDKEGAYDILCELLDETQNDPYFRWREGSLYYSALILLDRSDDSSKSQAIAMLDELLEKHSRGLIQIIEFGRDSYSVRWVVKRLARDRHIEQLLKRIEVD